MCGQILAAHDRDVRFRLPEPALSSPEQHRAEGSWLSDPDPTKATLMQIPNISPFVRALLPIKLPGGHAYTDLKLTGYLANKIQPWGRYKVPVNLAVLNPDYTPYCVGKPERRAERRAEQRMAARHPDFPAGLTLQPDSV